MPTRIRLLTPGETMTPTPSEARAVARREIPRRAFRGVPVFDIRWSSRVLQDCTDADALTPRLWAPPVPR